MPDYGENELWGIAFNENELNGVYNTLIDFRKKNPEAIVKIAKWYRDNFFTEPGEDTIAKAFGLK